MRGWSYAVSGAPQDVLKLSDDLKEPAPNLTSPMLIDVHAVALNPDSCVLVKIMPNFLLRKTPRTPEIDFSGVISEGSKFSASCPFKPGDEVYGHVPPVKHVVKGIGTLSEQITVSANWLIRKPEGLSHVQAAALPTSFVSAYKLAKCVTPGARVFINGGSGGVGLLLIQLLKTWKQAIVTTTASSQSREIVEQQKPDYIVDYREVGDLASYLEEEYEPFDYCIDLIGDLTLLRQSNRILTKKGCFIAFGGGLSSSSIYQFAAWLIKTLFIGYMPRRLGGCGRSFRFVAVRSEDDTVLGLSMLEDFLNKGAGYLPS